MRPTLLTEILFPTHAAATAFLTPEYRSEYRTDCNLDLMFLVILCEPNGSRSRSDIPLKSRFDHTSKYIPFNSFLTGLYLRNAFTTCFIFNDLEVHLLYIASANSSAFVGLPITDTSSTIAHTQGRVISTLHP